MKRLSLVTAIALIGTLLFASVALALISGPPSTDVMVDSTGVLDNTTLMVLGSSYNAASQACTINSWGYLKWDRAMSADADYADLTMQLVSKAGVGAGTVVNLYGIDNDNWTDTAAPIPANPPGTFLSYVTISTATANGPVTFPTSDAFVKFMNDNRSAAPHSGNDIASFVVQITSSCTTNAIIRFGTLQGGNPANLNVRIGSPNAVEVSAASAQQNSSWPLYAGLGAVALFVVAGVVISRRRTA